MAATGDQRLAAAAILLKNEIKQDLSAPSPPRSTPGESPHKDTGRLRASISHEFDTAEHTARVGTNLVYGKWLEVGTKNMEARPFLRKAFNEHFQQIKKILRGK